MDITGHASDPSDVSDAGGSACSIDTDGDGLCDDVDPCPLHTDNIQDICRHLPWFGDSTRIL